MEEGFVRVWGKKIPVENSKLNLSTLEITYIDYEIEGLLNQKNLRYLDLSGNCIEALSGLENLTNLQTLDLSHNYIHEIHGLEHLTRLQRLALRYNGINEIKGLENLTNLQTLDLSHNIIEEIKGLKTLNRLYNLNLSYNQIKKIKGLGQLTSLQKIDLRDNPLNANDKFLVRKSAHQIVKYCRENIDTEDTEGYVIVKGAKYYVKDGKLDLSGLSINQITEIKGLEFLTNLKNLDLRNNPLRGEEQYLIEKSAQEVVRFYQKKIGSRLDKWF